MVEVANFEIVVFEFTPLTFHRIEFRTVGWEIHNNQPFCSPFIALFLNSFTGMNTGSIQDQRSRASWISLLNQRVEKCHNIRTSRVGFNFTVLDFACSEVYTAHQVQSGFDPTRFTGWHSQRIIGGTPAVGVRLSLPDCRLIEK